MRPWRCNYGSLCGTGSDLSSRRMRSWVLLPVCRACLGHCTWGVSNLAIIVYQGLCEIINLAPLLRRNSIGVQDLRWWPWLRWHLKLAPSLIVNILWVLICIASLFVWCVRYTLLQEALVWWMAPVCARYVHPATVPCATRKHLSRNGHTFRSYFVALLVQLVKICLHLVV